MAAYNYIIENATCPCCSKIGEIKFQTHVASSFEGNEKGRFSDHYYRIGDIMMWFDKSDKRYLLWKNGNSKNKSDKDSEIECCYGTCEMCDNECYGVINFENLTILAVKKIGIITEWPDNFYK